MARDERAFGLRPYVDDTDLESKSTLGLLTQLFNLLAGDVKLPGPVLTLPVGN